MMAAQVDAMEERVVQAEKDLAPSLASNFKKVFTSFLPRRQSQVNSADFESVIQHAFDLRIPLAIRLCTMLINPPYVHRHRRNRRPPTAL